MEDALNSVSSQQVSPPNAPRYFSMIIVILCLFLLASLIGNIWLLNQNRQLQNELDIKNIPFDPAPEEIPQPPPTQSVLINGEPINADGTFSLNPPISCAGDIIAQVIATTTDSVEIEVLKREGPNNQFYPGEQEKFTIKNDACMDAVPLCTDVDYDYCFRVAQDGDQLKVTYTILSGGGILGYILP